jgi:ferritin
MNTKEIELLNYRINQEELSSRLYEFCSLWLDVKGLANTSKLYKKYSEEELAHAQKAKDFLTSYNIVPTLQTLPEIDKQFKTLEDVLKFTLEHELDITRQCEELLVASRKSNCGTLETLALFYCEEQIEELDKSYNNIDFLSNCGGINILFDNYIGELL